MRLIFVRHGEANYEKDCLTDLGLKQAQAAAKRLMREGIEGIYSSPQGRAIETARAYAQLDGGKDVQVLDFMHEISWGSTDGEPLFNNGHPWTIADEMVAQGWDLTRSDWREHPFFKRNKAAACADAVAEELDKWLLTLGYRREGSYYRQTLPEDNRHTYALFSHGGSSTAALSHLMDLPFPYMLSLLHMPFTAIVILRFDPKPNNLCLPHLELAGDSAHCATVEQ